MYRTQIALSTLVILALVYAVVFWDRMALAGMVANSWQGWKLTQGMVGYWSFDGRDVNWTQNRALDRSGQGNNGTLTNMSTTTSPTVGKMGQGLSFDGANDRVRVPNQASLGITADITMSAWVKRNQIDEYHAIITKSDGAAWDYGFFIFYDSPGHADNNKLNFYTTGSGSNLSTGKITDTNWHHVAVTRLGSNGTFYIDGTAAGIFTLAGALANNAFPVEIGWDGTSGFVDGTIDDVRLYNRALSAEEVKRLYLMGASMVTNASQNSKLTQGLVGLWSFDGPDINWTENRALDRSGQGSNGDLTNMSTTTSPVEGKMGQALLFDNVDDHVRISDSSTFSFTNGSGTDLPYSLSAWVYMNDITETAGIVGKWRSAGNNMEWVLRISGSAMNIENYHFDNSAVEGRSIALTAAAHQNRWIHVVATYDGSEDAGGFRIYFDGVRVDTTSTDGAYTGMTDAAAALEIGAYNAGGNNLNGKIDDVRIYNRALSAEEIKRLYLMGNSMVENASQNSKLTQGLVGLWSFDGPDINWTQNSALDRSGQGSNGELTNMSTTTSPAQGKMGQGLHFDGVNDYVSVDAVANDVQSGDFSVSLWFKPRVTWIPANETTCDNLLETADASSNNDILIFLSTASGCNLSGGNTKALRVGLGNGSGYDELNSTATSLNGGQWYHVVLTYSTVSGSVLYIDNVSNATDAGTSRGSTFATTASIGRNTVLNNSFFAGTVDDVRIYNRALSVDEVNRLYLIGGGR